MNERPKLRGLTRGLILSSSVKARKCVVFGHSF